MHLNSTYLFGSMMTGVVRRYFSKSSVCRCIQSSINTPTQCENKNQQKLMPHNGQVQTVQTTKKLADLQIDWHAEMDQIETERTVLQTVNDESEIYAEPMLRPTFNLAAYVRKSETLQQLLKLGVDLSQLERLRVGQFIVNLDFKTDIEPYIIYLTQDVGIPIDGLGKFFTRNPNVLREHLDDIQTRINYLELKKFSRDDIASIVTRNANWLNYSTREIDGRLGFIKNHFELQASEVRIVTINCPKLITHSTLDVEKISFSMREECGFDNQQIKQLVQKCPKLWMMHRYELMKHYDFVTDFMKIENSQLVATPHILAQRIFRIKERHGFLKKIGRAQYNPKLPLYVSIDDLCKGTDDQFAVEIAKKPYEEYDRYLRTL